MPHDAFQRASTGVEIRKDREPLSPDMRRMSVT
jgi:hypothetical protein